MRSRRSSQATSTRNRMGSVFARSYLRTIITTISQIDDSLNCYRFQEKPFYPRRTRRSTKTEKTNPKTSRPYVFLFYDLFFPSCFFVSFVEDFFFLNAIVEN